MVEIFRFYLGLVVVVLVTGPFRADSTGPSSEKSSSERYKSSDAAVAKVLRAFTAAPCALAYWSLLI